MNRPLTAALIGAALVTQAVSASDGFAGDGRYQLIPKVPVPSQTGKSREQAILLDTKTGQTWRLARDAKKGKTKGAHWVPLDLIIDEQVNIGDASIAAKGEKKKRGAFGASKPHANPTRRLSEDYDDDP